MNTGSIEDFYRLYRDEIKKPAEEEIESISFNLDKNKKENILKMFKQPIQTKEEQEQKKNIKQGDIFLFFKEHIPIYFIILDKIAADLYEVLKVSPWWVLANQNDFFIKIDNETFIIETWNNFILTEEEIKKASFVSKLSDKDLNILLSFIEEGKNLPAGRKGLEVPEGDYSFVQNKFHKDEAMLVKDYALRVFDLVEDEGIIELPPERLKEQPLAAGEEEESYIGENFVLFFDKENNLITLEPAEELIGKPALIKIFDEEFKTEELPEEVLLKVSEEVKSVNLSFVGKNIKIEVEG